MRRDLTAIDTEFRAHRLEPIAPFASAANERECRCVVCGTVRWVRLRTLRRNGIACRWCHGWERWEPWGESSRRRALTGGTSLGDPAEVMRRLRHERLAPLTAIGDLYRAVGVVCLECGESFVTMPERMSVERPGWYGCARCSAERKQRVLSGADELFEANGLRLVGACRGEYVPQRAVCLACQSERRVSYDQLRAGTTPLCWTCTHGIRSDEPHRVYLFHFPNLGVMKVGLTHDRHDRRLWDHVTAGGKLISSVPVADREAARRLESFIRAKYVTWAATELRQTDFPQGGWTETWRDDAPPLDLPAAADLVTESDDGTRSQAPAPAS